MGRIRTIKPEFPQSETVGDLSRDARLLFIQLWTIVDDDGRARAHSRMLASLLYPYDDDAGALIGAWLDELEEAGCVRRYEVDGTHYLDIPKWREHQKIDHPKPSRLPEYREPSTNIREASRSVAPDLGPRTMDQGRDQEDIRAVAKATRPAESQEFWKRFKAEYPKRDGANPWKPAEKLFLAAIKSGVEPQVMIDAATRYSTEMVQKGQVGTPYVAQAATWLRQQRYLDYPPAPEISAIAEQPEGAPSDDELRRLYAERNQKSGGEKVLRGRGGGDGGAGVQVVEGNRTEGERDTSSDDQPRSAGVRSLAGVLRTSSSLGAIRDAVGDCRRSEIDDGPGSMAAMV